MNYTFPMRIILLCLMMAMTFSPPGFAAPRAELVTVPSEGSARVEREDYASAREEAMKAAFRAATRKAVAGIVPAAEFEKQKELIEEKVVSRGEDFVESYKFLGESVDAAEGSLTTRMQVTLFLDTIRNIVRGQGVKLKRRELPKLMIIMDERTAGFSPGENFLLSKSESEETLAELFRERGYQVVDREEVKEANLEDQTISAMKGDKKAVASLAGKLEVDLLALGRTEVSVTPSSRGEKVEVIVTLALLQAPGAEKLVRRMDKAEGVYDDALEGSLETIRKAARSVGRELALDVKSKWREIKEMEDE